jgi:lipopolysaccharide/colanic/teichoic acid biosynthesis glycosyltransferase
MSTRNTENDEVVTAFPDRASAIKDRYEVIKPYLDRALALVILLITLPIILLAIVLVKVNSRGRAIYTQKRVGSRGQVFTIYKIRTMYDDSERTSGPRWSAPGDPRVTFIGRLLRWSHVDELPQLINILMGQMSLVGPRPERPEFVDQLERALPDYRRRLLVRPGLTGLAQVQQSPDTDLFSVRRKLNYDLYYVDRLNPWLDFRLIIGTVLKCMGCPFVWIGRILQLPDPNPCQLGKSHRAEPEFTASALVSNSYMQ